MNIEEIVLPKWPQLVVVGEPVTKDQAAEIIIRATDLDFCSNDDEFEKELNDVIDKLFNLKLTSDYKLNYKRLDELNKKTNSLDIFYLDNARIVSCWIGGPKGWIDWDGIVGCSNYNIGKWPSVVEVLKEWELIAKAFPYLNLKSQLMSGESCEDNIPIVEYEISDSKVSVYEPKERLICNVPYVDSDHTFAMNFRNKFRERGCTLEQFESALKLVDYNHID